MTIAARIGIIGGQLLGIVPSAVLLPMLALILIVSAVKVWNHKSLAMIAVGYKSKNHFP